MKGLGVATHLETVTETDSFRQEIEWEKERRNFVRAACLAAKGGLEAEERRMLERNSVRQFIEEFRNFEGAARLISEYGLNRQEVQEIVDEVLASPETRQRTFCFYKGKPTSMSLAERVDRFVASYHR